MVSLEKWEKGQTDMEVGTSIRTPQSAAPTNKSHKNIHN